MFRVRLPAAPTILSLALLALFAQTHLAGCSAPTARFQVRLPAEIDVGDIERVAVADFDGLQQSGLLVAAKLTEGIVSNGRFQMFEREKLQDILSEREFSRSDHVDPATAHQLKLAGVDALIFGVVDVYSVDDQTGITKVEKKVSTGEYETVQENDGQGSTREVQKEIVETVLVDRGHVIREGTMGVTFRMASVNTGQIVAIKAETVHFSQKVWEDERQDLPAKEMILESLSREVAQRFLRQIQPQVVMRTARFENNEAAETEVGIKYAKAGLWDKAALSLRSVAVAIPTTASAHYNLGLAYDALGQHGSAADSIERAIQLDPKDRYIQVLAQVRRNAQDTAVLRNQEAGL
ncbi:MAG: hypothetical protein DHS20C21_14710 [Gemmatimonadota bacterium]|nr:MAG: hypothetical protein DHS20C21_14710 [Gemmatimonadota bacterium]